MSTNAVASGACEPAAGWLRQAGQAGGRGWRGCRGGAVRLALMAGLLLAVLLLGPSPGTAAQPAFAAADTEGPVLVAFDFTPKTVDVSTESATVTFTAHITDPSGLAEAMATNSWISSPSGAHGVGVRFWAAHRISGTPEDGVYQYAATIGAHAEPGSWRVHIDIADAGGYHTQLTPEQVEAAGFPATLQVTSSSPDLTPPEVTALDFNPRTVDVSYGPQSVTFTVHLVDTPAGIDTFGAWFASAPGTPGQAGAVLDATDRTSGDAYDGEYRAMVTIPEQATAGDWTLGLALTDSLGNGGWVDSAELAALGFPATLTVIAGPPDAAPPQVLAFDFNPKTVDVYSTDRQITVSAHFTDDVSGLRAGGGPPSIAVFRSPSGTYLDASFDGDGNRVSGTRQDGEFEASIYVSPYAEPGTWTLDHLELVDQAGNSAWLTTAELAAKGFPTAFTVTDVAGPPVGASYADVTGVTQTSITLHWVDNANNERGYQVYRVVPGPSVRVPGCDFVTPNLTSCTDTGLTPGVLYLYHVWGWNDAGPTYPGTYLAVRTLAAAPAAPALLSAVGRSTDSILLTWKDNSENETGFKIYRWDGSKNVFVASVADGATSYTVGGLAPGVSYVFTMTAYNSGGETYAPQSIYAQTLAAPPSGTPTPPTYNGVTAATATSLTIAWTNNAGSAVSGFMVYRVSPGPSTLVAGCSIANPALTSCTDTGLTPGKAYAYQVWAWNLSGASNPGTYLVGRTLGTLAAPTLLSANGETPTTFRVQWRDNTSTESGFKVYQWDGSKLVLRATVPANTASYTDTGLTAGKGYVYSVSAYNSEGEAYGSLSIWAHTPPAPGVTSFVVTGATELAANRWRMTADYQLTGANDGRWHANVFYLQHCRDAEGVKLGAADGVGGLTSVNFGQLTGMAGTVSMDFTASIVSDEPVIHWPVTCDGITVAVAHGPLPGPADYSYFTPILPAVTVWQEGVQVTGCGGTCHGGW